MVLHPWKRRHEVANLLGLILLALAIFLTGLNIKSMPVMIIGIVTLILFTCLFSIILYLIIRDYRQLYPIFKKSSLGIRY